MRDTMKLDDFAELRRLLAAAPPGAYVPDIDDTWTGKIYVGMNRGPDTDGEAICTYNDDKGTRELIEYLCAAGGAVPALLAALEGVTTQSSTPMGFEPALSQEGPNPEREAWLRGLLRPGADYGSVGLHDLQYMFQALDAARADLERLARAVRLLLADAAVGPHENDAAGNAHACSVLVELIADVQEALPASSHGPAER